MHIKAGGKGGSKVKGKSRANGLSGKKTLCPRKGQVHGPELEKKPVLKWKWLIWWSEFTA